MSTPRHPHVHVQLTGKDGNAFAILARCQKAMCKAGLGAEVDAFMAEATAGDYNHLLRTVMAWFEHDEGGCTHCGCTCQMGDDDD